VSNKDIQVDKTADLQQKAGCHPVLDTGPSPTDAAKGQDESQTTAGTNVSKASARVKFIGLIAFVVVLVVLTVCFFLFVPIDKLTSQEGRDEIITLIQGAGAAGVLVCLVLQFIQVVVAFIPGEVVQVAIGAVYGPLWGSIITVAGALISSAFVFVLVRRLGAPFVQGMLGKKDNKWVHYLMDENRGLDVLVLLLFMIPMLPKDLFTYIFPLTKIRPFNFLLLSTVARTPSIVASSFFGGAIAQGDYSGAIIIGVVAGVLALLVIIFNKQVMAAVDHLESRMHHHK
jgi:uncharacterized membrane protein YdjX (TVP38/TMEM64 family)